MRTDNESEADIRKAAAGEQPDRNANEDADTAASLPPYLSAYRRLRESLEILAQDSGIRRHVTGYDAAVEVMVLHSVDMLLSDNAADPSAIWDEYAGLLSDFDILDRDTPGGELLVAMRHQEELRRHAERLCRCQDASDLGEFWMAVLYMAERVEDAGRAEECLTGYIRYLRALARYLDGLYDCRRHADCVAVYEDQLIGCISRFMGSPPQ